MSDRYSVDHLWLREGGDGITVGITERISRAITLVEAVHLPSPGARIPAGAELASIDAQKAEFELPAPVAMTVVAVNARLEEEPILVRLDPRGEGWLAKVTLERAEDWDTLLDQDEHERVVEAELEEIAGQTAQRRDGQ